MSEYRFLPLVDAHAHLNLEDFAPDLDDVVARSRAGRFPAIRGRRVEDPLFRPFVAGIVCPGVDLESSRAALELTRRYPGFAFAAVGIHPNYTAEAADDDWEKLERLALDANDANDDSNADSPDVPAPRVVALGETGLDRYWDDAPFDLQAEYFRRHLELGRRTGLPVIIHSRDANDDLAALLRDFCASEPRPASTPNGARAPRRTIGVVHSFSGTPEQAAEWVEFGFYLGFGGFSTYTSKKFAGIWEAARAVPSDKLLLETDCPFLTPSPLRGKLERNEPLTTAFVAKRLAELRDVPLETLVRQALDNAVRFFRLPKLADAPAEYAAAPDSDESTPATDDVPKRQ